MRLTLCQVNVARVLDKALASTAELLTTRGAAEGFFCIFISEKISQRVMYPWPTGDFDNVMDIALDIAMNYLDLTGQAEMYEEVRSTAAMAITAAWKIGVRHRILGSPTSRSRWWNTNRNRF
jgi:hypothetical protein